MGLAVYLEIGNKRVFASAVDWPGWSRSAPRRARQEVGEVEQAALAALEDYLPRYREVAERAGLVLPAGPGRLDVVERVSGDMTTDFGAPSTICAADREPADAALRRRFADLLTAAWSCLDDAVATAPPSLRKGPRGGGRDRDAVVDHVLGAEAAYLRSVGIKAGSTVPAPQWRARFVEALTGRADVAAKARGAAPAETFSAAAESPVNDPFSGTKWPLRYTVRRTVWHVLDHTWEIQDRSGS